jgi:hypothetical protein
LPRQQQILTSVIHSLVQLRANISSLPECGNILCNIGQPADEEEDDNLI